MIHSKEKNSTYQEFLNEYSGYIIQFSNKIQQDTLNQKIRRGSRFTEAMAVSPFKQGRRDVIFITFDGINIKYCCLVKRQKLISSSQHMVKFNNYVELSNISLHSLSSDTQERITKYIIKGDQTSGKKIDQLDWAELLRQIEYHDADSFRKCFQLYLNKDATLLSIKTPILNLINDAYYLVLNLAGLNLEHPDLKVKFHQQSIEQKTTTKAEFELPPFLQRIQGKAERIYEDDLIIHDTKLFPGYEKISNSMTSMEQFIQNDRRVTVISYNRYPIEQVLGIDLLYYNHYYNSYLLIQYKKLEDGKYYPLSDRAYKKEVVKMESLTTLAKSNIANSENNVQGYRLNPDFCYFKLVDPLKEIKNENHLIQGMYIPLSLWKILLDDQCTQGKKGGRIIGYDQVDGRYLSNTRFLELYRDGWIGSCHISSEIITPLIMDILDGKRTAIVALT